LSSSQSIDPERTPIFHITHSDNLPGIISAGGLMSDARRRRGDFGCTNIGHMHIKDRRMHRPVPVAAGGVLGEYVPFNFCNRSVMLYVIYRNGVDGYSGGQQPVVHLVSTIGEATRCGRPWALTDRHAELGYALYFDDPTELHRVNWKVMPLQDWRGQEIKETRQAEFLVHDCFPWACVKAVGVHNSSVAQNLTSILRDAPHQPKILLKPEWYY